MLSGYVFFIIFVTALYIYTNENRQIAATASVVRQIWSGGCHLSCRHSEFSDNSIAANGFDRFPGRITSQTNSIGPSHGCLCQPCPCPLVENVFRRCDTVTEAYNNIHDSIAELYDSVLKTMSDLQNYVSRVSECGLSCPRELQANGNNPSTGNSNVRETIDKRKTSKLKQGLSDLCNSSAMSKLPLVMKSSSRELNGGSTSEKRENTDKDICRESLVNLRHESVESEASTGCPKCIQKGKICISGCPSAAINKQ